MPGKKATIQWLNDLCDPELKPAQGYVLFLNGFSDVDTLVIAQAIKAKLPEDTTRHVDNDTLIGIAEAIFPAHGATYEEAKIRRVALGALSQAVAENPALEVIMTGCLVNNKEDTEVLAEHVHVAGYAKVPFFFINLTGGKQEDEDEEEVEGQQQVESAEQAEDKENDVRRKRALGRIVESWKHVDATKLSEELREEGKVECFTLDVTGLGVEQVVGKKMRRMYE